MIVICVHHCTERVLSALSPFSLPSRGRGRLQWTTTTLLLERLTLSVFKWRARRGPRQVKPFGVRYQMGQRLSLGELKSKARRVQRQVKPFGVRYRSGLGGLGWEGREGMGALEQGICFL